MGAAYILAEVFAGGITAAALAFSLITAAPGMERTPPCRHSGIRQWQPRPPPFGRTARPRRFRPRLLPNRQNPPPRLPKAPGHPCPNLTA